MAKQYRMLWVILLLPFLTAIIFLFNDANSFAQSGDDQPLTPDEPANGNIEFPDEVDGWLFDGVGNRDIEISVIPSSDSTLIPIVSLFDTSQNELTSIQGSPTAIISIKLPATSTYRVTVSGADGMVGAYEILLKFVPLGEPSPTMMPEIYVTSTLIPPTLPNAPPPTFMPSPPEVGQPIMLGETIDEELDEGRWDVWQFDGNSGQRVTIRLRASDFDAFVELYSPMNPRMPLYTDDDSGRGRNATLFNVLLPENGIYRIFVRSFEDSGAGNYRLSVEPDSGLVVSVETSQPIVYSDQVNAVLENEQVVYYFMGNAGDIVTILLDSPDFDTYVELLAADNAIIEANDDNGRDRNSVIRNFQLPSDGFYFIIVTSFNYDSMGNFTLELLDMTTVSQSVGGNLTLGETVTARLLPATSAEWTFEGKTSQVISTSAAPIEPEARYDLVLELVDPAGNILITDDQSGYRRNPAITDFRLPSDGTYMLRIYEFNITVGGSYRLSLAEGRTYFSPLAEPALFIPLRPEPLIVMTDTLDDSVDTHRLWVLGVHEGQPLYISVFTGNEDIGTPQDFEIFILDTAWESVAESRSGDIYVEPAPATTDYLILLHYRGSGLQTYQLQISFAPIDTRPPIPVLGEIRLDSPRTGILAEGERHAWRFTAPQNGEYDFTIMRQDESSSYDPYLVVVDETGERIAEDDDSAGGLNPRVTLELMAGQSIMVHVTSFADTNGGSYEVIVTQE